MTLCDAGPLVALLDEGERKNHRRCVAALDSVTMPLLTTWPCFTEAMYLVGRGMGYPGQQALWQMHLLRRLIIDESPGELQERMRELMSVYQDIPMDLADASLLAAAEKHHNRRIFTLDDHFYAYRTFDGQPLEVIP